MDLGLVVGSAYGPGSGRGSGRAPGSGQKKHMFPVGFLVVLTKTLEKPAVFALKVVIWLEVCVSSGNFTRSS